MDESLICTIYPMREEDIPQVMEIEGEAFPGQWPPPSYKKELKNRLARYFVLAENHQRNNIIFAEKGLAETGQKGASRWWKVLPLARYFFRGNMSVQGQHLFQQERRVLGAAGFWLMFDEAHITTIAVRASYRRMGFGELLLAYTIDMAAELNAQVVTLEVRVSNTVAQQLYEKYGFNKVGYRKGYYTDNGEDGIIMTTDRVTAASFQSRLQALKRNLTLRLGQRVCLPGSFKA